MRTFRRRVFSAGPGDPRAGVADCPTEVLGVAVRTILLVREDVPAALVLLADQRFAMTGKVTAIGNAADLGAHARRRAQRCPSTAEQQWLHACAEHLAAGDAVRPGRPSLGAHLPLR